MSYKNFEIALEFLFQAEGGYSNRSDDRGGPTNLGVTQTTYNDYNRRHNLLYKNIKDITRDEAIKIYYNDYWIPSGADSLSDPKMGILLFDTSVLHGVNGAKVLYDKSGGDINKFLQARRNSYDNIVANDSSQMSNYRGWLNRVDHMESYLNNLDKNKLKKENTGFASNIENNMNVMFKHADKNGNIVYTNSDDDFDFKDLEKIDRNYRIMHDEEMKTINPVKDSDYTDAYVRNSYNDKKYTKSELNSEVSAGGMIYVESYTRRDGTKVTGYYRKK